VKNAVKIFMLLAVLTTPASAAEPRFFIRLNETGYRPHEIKNAVAFSRDPLPPQFRLLNAKTGVTVFTGATVPVAGGWGQFAYHGELNFSSFSGEGIYVIEFGSARSQEFAINRNIRADLADQMLEFMRQQRCGYNPYVNAACHTFDGRTAYGPLPPGTYLNASGGWHDAGDQLKYLLTSSNATAQMLLAYQLVNESRSKNTVFADRFNHLGRPGTNGIADVLDEARWGLEWMLRLHPAKATLTASAFRSSGALTTSPSRSRRKARFTNA